MDDLMEALKWLDTEYGGFADMPDGAYYVALNRQNSKAHTFDKGTKFRLGWKVTHGEFANREVGDFLQWRRDTEDGTAQARRHVASIIKAVQAATGDTLVGAASISILRNSQNVEQDMQGFASLATEIGSARLPIRLVSTQKKERNGAGEEVVVATYQNIRYLDKGKPVEATDPAELAAVRV